MHHSPIAATIDAIGALTPVGVIGDLFRVQTTRPRDLGAVALIVGLFLILFIVSALGGQTTGL